MSSHDEQIYKAIKIGAMHLSWKTSLGRRTYDGYHVA